MGDINTNIRIDQLQTIVKAIAKRGSIRTKVTTFYPASSGDSFDFTPDPDAVLTAWATRMSSPTQWYTGMTVGPFPDNSAPNNYSMMGTNQGFTYMSGYVTFYYAAPGGFHILEIIVDGEST